MDNEVSVLNRALDVAAAENRRLIDENVRLRAELAALREQEPFDAGDERFRQAFDATIARGNWPATRKGAGYRSPMTQMAWEVAFGTVNRLRLYAAPVAKSAVSVPEGWESELLDWVSACQSAYHIDNTPGHRFGGLGSNLDENRQSLVEYVRHLIAAPEAKP